MGVPIRINEIIYNEAKKVARSEFRSIPHQIEFWASLGKCALDNPDLPIEFIKDTLISKHQDRSLAEPFDFEIPND
ncbi:MAG: TA system antitoxin ParD family protein [Legionella sp.]